MSSVDDECCCVITLRTVDYIIHYGEVEEGETEPKEWQTITVPSSEVKLEKHKIHDLKPKTHYAIKVQAVNERGPGVESDPIVVKTLPLGEFLLSFSRLLYNF